VHFQRPSRPLTSYRPSSLNRRRYYSPPSDDCQVITVRLQLPLAMPHLMTAMPSAVSVLSVCATFCDTTVISAVFSRSSSSRNSNILAKACVIPFSRYSTLQRKKTLSLTHLLVYKTMFCFDLRRVVIEASCAPAECVAEGTGDQRLRWKPGRRPTSCWTTYAAATRRRRRQCCRQFRSRTRPELQLCLAEAPWDCEPVYSGKYIVIEITPFHNILQ